MTDFAKTRQMFDIPEGMIYLNGNSLGPMPKAAPKAINSFLMDEWRAELVLSLIHISEPTRQAEI